MRLYSNKQKWKIILLLIALILVGASIYVSNSIVNKVAKRERERVTQWADAIKKRAELVRLTNNSFDELRKKELGEMQLWIDATKTISKKSPLNTFQSYDLPLEIINKNKDIPVIVLDGDGEVSTYINLGFTKNNLKKNNPKLDATKLDKLFSDSLVKLAHSWEQVNPSFTIEVYDNMYMTYFYNDSRSITRLEKERDSLIVAFNEELIRNPGLVPVILTDSTKKKVLATNLPFQKVDTIHLNASLSELASSNRPIKIRFSKKEYNYVFYANSPELVILQYYPYIQFIIIGLFIFIGYLIFSTFRKAEQNQVWAGMAKETAHQLGTPISSLMAWAQLLEAKEDTQEIATEINKDVDRLTTITDRFSKIGAITQLKDLDLIQTIQHFLSYYRTRLPETIHLYFNSEIEAISIPHNAALFEWVVENICKNAVDALDGVGAIKVNIKRQGTTIYVDISDDGKGMTAAQQRNVFRPGYTTKKRGWGLGMSLSKRIIHEYHKGKLKILNSELGKGTTFRIYLYL